MIAMNDFKADPPALTQEMLSAASRVLESGWYVLGNEVATFEARWAKASGAAHCVGVGNGMDAIEIILRAMGIGPGDEVITTSMTAFATVLAILRSGATPVLADLTPGSGLLDPESVQRCLTRRTKALLLVHLYGEMRQMDRWQSLCTGADLILVEDCAQSHLARWKGRVSGTFGAAGAYSFYPTKNLGAIGDAGAIVTNDDRLAQRASRLRNYGQSERYVHPELGMNSRLDELQAALLLARLDWLDTFTRRRRAICAALTRGIDNAAVRLLPAPEEEEAHVHHLFVIRCTERDRLQAHLTQRGVQSLSHYPVPIHRQDPCRALSRDPKGLRNAEDHAATCLSLPCHPQMTDAQVQAVIDAVNSFAANG
jgi:dTDP-4-amino-4,6-dideoxygalactose transaminase